MKTTHDIERVAVIRAYDELAMARHLLIAAHAAADELLEPTDGMNAVCAAMNAAEKATNEALAILNAALAQPPVKEVAA